MEHITLITTGGTIDKIYGAGKGVMDMCIGSPFAFNFLERTLGKKSVGFISVPLMMKDSLEMTDGDRQRVVDHCKVANTSKIIVTHGTDTIIETAALIKVMQVARRRTIVLTGALQPAVMKNSDAEFNLGMALGACLHARPGIYIAINGVHRWNECYKHPDTGMFLPS